MSQNGRSSAKDLLENLKKRKAELMQQRENGNRGPPPPQSTKPAVEDSPSKKPKHSNAADLLASIRRRKAELEAKASEPPKMVAKPALEPAPEPKPVPNPYLSSEQRFTKRSRPLIFNRPGKYIDLANEQRERASTERAKQEFNVDELRCLPTDPPAVEWWDVQAADAISQKIQNPVEIDPPWEQLQPENMKIYLTSREVKRKRKHERYLKRKEAQDRVKLGLDPPPPSKLSSRNVLAVYGSEYYRDPTKYEQIAQEQVKGRRAKHDADNAARKLTGEQKWEKHVEKVGRDEAHGLFCAVFIINNLTDGKHRFLVDYTAKKFLLTGVTLYGTPPQFTVVLVEGAALEIKKFTKLLVSKIDWTRPAPIKEGSDETPASPETLAGNECRLVWTGEIKARKFKKWSVHNLGPHLARELLDQHAAGGYWNLAQTLAKP